MWNQIGLFVFGATAIFLSQSEKESVRKYSSLFGLASQPFWFYAAYTAQNWGMFAVCFLYLLAWSKGVWSFWIKPLFRK